MAEIALLVAEEFENRKKWAKEDGIEAINRMAYCYASALGEKLGDGVGLLRKEVEVAKRAVQPRSSLASAAFDGLFSA